MNPQIRQLFRTIDQSVNQLRQIVGNSQITTENQQVGGGRGRGRGKKGRARNFSDQNYMTFGQLRRQGGGGGRDPGFTDNELFEMLDRAKVNPANNGIDVTTREGNILLSYGWVDDRGRLHPEIAREFSMAMGEVVTDTGGGTGGGSGGSGGSFNRPLHRGGNRVLTGS